MFESVKQGGQVRPMVYVTSLLISLAAHAVILCVIIIAPLVFFSALHAEELITFLYAPPAPPPAPPAPTPPAQPGAARHGRTVTGEFRPPRELPKGIPDPEDSAEVFIPSSIAQIPGVSGTPGGGGLTGIVTMDLPKAPDPPPPPITPKTPVRVGVLQQSKLIYKVNPVYPELARRARVSGDVILEAVIDEEGTVSTIKVLSGHALLNNAAIEAVRQWKYSPTILSGEPVQVIATVTVMFRLNN
jgi:periplasmic protein TonB